MDTVENSETKKCWNGGLDDSNGNIRYVVYEMVDDKGEKHKYRLIYDKEKIMKLICLIIRDVNYKVPGGYTVSKKYINFSKAPEIRDSFKFFKGVSLKNKYPFRLPNGDFILQDIKGAICSPDCGDKDDDYYVLNCSFVNVPDLVAILDTFIKVNGFEERQELIEKLINYVDSDDFKSYQEIKWQELLSKSGDKSDNDLLIEFINDSLKNKQQFNSELLRYYYNKFWSLVRIFPYGIMEKENRNQIESSEFTSYVRTRKKTHES